MRACQLLLLSLLLSACDDPASSFPPAPGAAPGEGGGPGPATPAGPGGDGPGQSEGCGPTEVAMGLHPFDAGEGTTIKGELSYAEESGQQVLLELMTVEQGGQSSILFHFVCHGLGDFEVEAPPDLGPAVLVAIIDLNGDGPTATEPGGFSDPIDIGSEPITGVKIAIEDGADLGAYAVPNAPPPAAGDALPPAEGAPPPEGEPPLIAPPPDGEPPSEDEPPADPPGGQAPTDEPPPAEPAAP